MERRNTKKIQVGNAFIGGDSPISVQSMTNTDTLNTEATINQIKELEGAGCEIIRVTAPSVESAKKIKKIKENINIPLIADIHFDYKIALECVKSKVDGLRLNPGNIGDENRIKEVVLACKDNNIPIRIGVNSGSIEKQFSEKYGVSAKAMVESALSHVKILEKYNFDLIKISIKATDIYKTIESYKLLANYVDYPFHIGITEAGTLYNGIIKSSIGIGILLNEGLGDTIRVSLTANPTEEVKAGIAILKNLNLKTEGITFISCPTCGRAQDFTIETATKIEEELKNIKQNIKVAVMGCIVNGPGEAGEADFALVLNHKGGNAYFKGKKMLFIEKNSLIQTFVSFVKENIISK